MPSSTVISNFKPLKTAAELRLVSLRSIFTTSSKTPSLSFAISATRPLKLQLSLKPKTHFQSIVSFVVQTSEAVAVEESGREEPTWENREDEAAEAADWEPDGEDSVVEASGAEGGESEFEEGGEEEDFSEPLEDAKLFVGNLSHDVDSQSLAMLFERAGNVEIAEVIYNRETNQSRGFGFVTMSTVEEAEKAAEKFHRYELNGRLLTVNKAAPRGSMPERPPHVNEPAYRIYVGNLQWDVDDARLEQVFSKHGKVLEARVVHDRETGRSRGFGFVTMSSEIEMNDAITALDGQDLEGRAIRVKAAQERLRRSF